MISRWRCVRTAALAGLLAGGLFPSAGAAQLENADEPPVMPVGLDAFRMWNKWAYLRIGQRTYMTSTYDRRGGNEAADASHFLFQLAEDRNITLDVMGPGVLAFKRTNHWHGSPWRYIVDGREYVVQESSTPDPDHPVENSVFLPEAQFPHPLTWTWSITKGADLMWVPIPFEESFRLAYGRTHYGTGYYIYHKYLPDAPNLSRPIKSWDMDVPSKDVLELINRSGSDIVILEKALPVAGTAIFGGKIKPGAGPIVIQDRTDGPAVIRLLEFKVDEADAQALGDCTLRIYWDGRAHPSVDAPIKLLYGTGSLFNRENKEYLVKAFPVNIRFADGKVTFSMYFPMPYLKSARLELVPADKQIETVNVNVRFEPYTDPANHVGYFHATYRDHGEPTPGHDMEFMDTRTVEGGGDWAGHFVGTSFIFSHRAVLNTLEGDPRFYFDDSSTPQAQGTGSEEWGGGGDYWGGRNMTIPFAGHPVGCRSKDEAKSDEDLIQSEYRFLLSDLMPFGKNARITFEHGGENNVPEHYKSVVFWYGIDRPFLVQTDVFNVGDPADEKRHNYDSPDASDVQTVTSRFEWGVDHFQGKEMFPATTDVGRRTQGASTFTLRLEPNNIGVLLRRKLDYAFPNQCAKVYVADDEPGAEWTYVGKWLTAGANTVVYSNPRAETGEAQHIVQTSNRRWREDEFMLPRGVTRGRSSIRVRCEFEPRPIRLFPTWPLMEQAWTEYQYKAYCFVMPMVDTED